MPHRHLRQLAALGAAIAMIPALVACGDDNPDTGDIPDDAVAVVGDTAIEQETFDRWVANHSRAQGLRQAPVPPRYEGCIAELRRQSRGQGVAKPKEADLKAQCATRWDQLRMSTMTFLIQSETNFQAAEDLDLELTAEDAKQKTYPTEKDYRAALKNSHLSEEDFLYQLRAQALPPEVTTQLQANADTDASEDEAEEYYEEHEEEFARPASRTASMITSPTKAKAQQVRKRLDGGDEWDTVAADVASATGPVATATTFTEGQANRGVDAIFKAEKDAVEGPVRTDTGWSVFKVIEITPAGTTPFDEVSDTVIDRLNSEREAKAVTDFQEEMKEKTACKEGYVVATCGNAPEPEAPAEQ